MKSNSEGSASRSGGGFDPSQDPRTKISHSPLSVIALFFGAVEFGLAYSAGVSSGSIQVAVLVFMALFATGIAITFFVFLWKRNWVFYPPSEFVSVPVQSYVDAMRHERPNISKIAAEGITRAFADEDLFERLPKEKALKEQQQTTIRAVMDEIRERALANVGASVICIDPRPLKGESDVSWEEPYDPDMRVHSFLNRIWFRLQPFAPSPYGTTWVLKDAETKKLLDEIGPSAPEQQRPEDQDDRSLEEVGIRGGMTLEVVATKR